MEAAAQSAPVHPVLEGRLDASLELADAVRRLIGLTTATRASQEDTLAAARELNAVADRLERHVPDPPLPKTIVHPADGGTDLAGRMPFDVVVGRHNPLAVPLTPRFEPPKAFLEGVFTRPYEGPPGCVHGAVIASSFDIILAAANFISGVSGPTARLEIFYRRPTLLDVPSVFEGWVEQQEDRSVRTVGRLLQNGRVTVEAVGEFVRLDREQMERLASRR
ncbi:PaaI family thioesterase [Actinocorallia libanotica]|uniref:Acyl-coenzyme A thioesterase THEM4 n=1 Tax=Actinocorallia libanotica TaxID=46162 RepID=A0ABN1RUG9_9ACTN